MRAMTLHTLGVLAVILAKVALIAAAIKRGYRDRKRPLAHEPKEG